MQSFGDLDATLALIPSQIVTMLRRIDLGAGSEALHRNHVPQLLAELAYRARVESITASSAIEGVIVPDPRRAEQIIADGKVELRTRDERQLAGYREALDYVFTTDWRELNVGFVLHVHRLLWSRTSAVGGQFKTEDNMVVDRLADGGLRVRFTPVDARQTEFYVSELIDRYLAAGRGGHHPVLLIGLFVLDLTVIHPFFDGNGRVARVLTNALLADAGYDVGRWISLEQLIAESADEYYAALLASTHHWHDGTADVWPWLTYFVGILASAYLRFAGRVTAIRAPGSKQGRVRSQVLNHMPVVFRIADLRAALPGVSDNTIRLALKSLSSEGVIAVDGTGRSATWRRIG